MPSCRRGRDGDGSWFQSMFAVLERSSTASGRLLEKYSVAHWVKAFTRECTPVISVTCTPSHAANAIGP